MNILINATNLHVGGGVQVASSFISELPDLLRDNKSFEVSVLCSEIVNKNLVSGLDKSFFKKFEVQNVYGLSILTRNIKSKFNGFDVCFTVFGPFYFNPKVKKHICGFAQPWIAYPNNDVYSNLNLIDKFKSRLKFSIQSHIFKQYDQLIVEQQHVKDALVNIGYSQDKIAVVSNCVSTIYDMPILWKSLNFDRSKLKYDINLGFIGRAYLHKNISVLKTVNDILINKYQFFCNFIFTFTKEEMDLLDFTHVDNFLTVGAIQVDQCPAFYNLLDALIFPSLLECFSASPIEAMKMDKTVIASGYPFVREVCGDAAFYFDPLSANDIASTIFNAFANRMLREKKKQLGALLVNNLPSAKDRAISYLNIISDSF